MEHGAKLQRAAALLRAGSLAQGETLCRQVLQATPGQPDALHFLALLARDRDDLTEAEALLRKAIEQTPDFVPAWHTLGKLLRANGRLDEARRCARKVTTLTPRNPAGWELLAAIEQAQNNPAAATAACREGLRHTPDAARLHYSLGQLLREDCCFAEAACAYESARSCGYETPERYQNHGEARFEAGDIDQALAIFSAGVTRYPDSALLHRLRARFHWETGAPGDPLEALRQAAHRNPRNSALWQAWVDLLNRLERKEEGRAVLVEAAARGCPQTPELLLLEAIGCAEGGHPLEATRLFARLKDAYPRHMGISLAFAKHLLSAGDPQRAESVCAEVLADNPLQQSAWAFRSTAWRLLGDPREAWLLDYERMVMPVRVPPPAGYASSDAFFSEVQDALETLHQMQAHPIEQSVRGGTQTNGFLFRLKHPLLRVLETQIRIAVGAALAAFPQDDGHPFWGRRSNKPDGDGFRFTGAWSVRLRSQGFHTNHIHPEGWISSALYIALPVAVRDAADSSGCIQFGVPPLETGLALPPRRIVKPQVGELVLFPSYMWHGTVPFTSEQPRVTVAFDLVPQSL